MCLLAFMVHVVITITLDVGGDGDDVYDYLGDDDNDDDDDSVLMYDYYY